MEGLIFKKQIVFLLILALLATSFFVFVFAQNNNSNPPSALNYAPNFQFDPDEQYYPTDPLDFYFVNGEEIEGAEAKAKYNNLSDEAKKNNFVVFYHIEDEGDHWVYEYWNFFVFNDNPVTVKNKHYGDWEAVFVFVDKKTKKVIRTIGTAHERRIFDTEIVNPKTNHIWAYVANGSHAICVDEENDERCNFWKLRRWEKWDKGGYVALYTRYKLKEITPKYIAQFNGAITLEKSPNLGIGGKPSVHPWAQLSYHNPEKFRPISLKYGAEVVLEQVKNTKDKIVIFFGGLFDTSITHQEAGIGGALVDNLDIISDNDFNIEQRNDLVVISVEEEDAPIQVQEKPAPVVVKEVKEKLVEPINTPEEKPILVEEKIEEVEEKEQISQSDIPYGLPFFPGGIPQSKTATTETVSVPAPTITSHSTGDILGSDDDYSTSTSGFQINLIGTSTPDFLVSVSLASTTVTTTDINGDWNYVIDLSEGENDIAVKAGDADGNESEETALTLIVDTTPPSDISDLSAVSGDTRGSVTLSWTAPGDSVAVSEYIVRYSTSSEITAISWASSTDAVSEPTPSIASSTESLTVSGLEAGKIYSFAVKSIDSMGNISAVSNSPSATASAISESVVISEVQIGVSEFVELYNPTDTPINMTGWYWSYYSSSRDWNDPYRNQQFLDNAIIPAGGYYLVGLGGYSTTSDLIAADWQVYDYNFLSGTDGSVAIFSANPATTTPEKAKEGLVDAIGWGVVNHVYKTTPTSAAVRYKTMVRQINGWDTNDNSADFIESGWPTPRNSQDERVALINDEFSSNQDILWTKEDSPYVLYSNLSKHPTVSDGATLTIEPGVVIKGSNKSYPSLIIQGALKAEGTADNPITFTSATTTQLAGDWSGIIFDNSTSSDSVLDYVNFEYGGYDDATYKSGGINFPVKEMLWINNSQVTIRNSTFKNSQYNGIRLVNSSSTISDSIFKNNALTGIIIDGGSPFVNGCEFDENNTGIEIINQASPIIDGNIFSANKRVIALKNAYPVVNNNQTSDNSLNGITVHQDSVFEQNSTWTNNLPYILSSGSGYGACPTVASGTTLILEQGVVVKPYSKYYTTLLVEGNLIAQGTSDSPIVFTSLKDDEYGGDTNNDGVVGVDAGAEAPASEDWKNIQFAAGSEGSLDYVHFRYGGYNTDEILDINPLSTATSTNITYYP